MLTYKKGDLFEDKLPDGDTEHTALVHVTNSLGIWGSGFVVPLARYYPRSKQVDLNIKPELGQFSYATYDNSKITIFNMCAQDGISCSKEFGPPIRYGALVSCMQEVRHYCKHNGIGRIIGPKFGSCRSGGEWKVIESLIKEIWGDLDVTIYELEQE